jgi:hypothetical protein
MKTDHYSLATELITTSGAIAILQVRHAKIKAKLRKLKQRDLVGRGGSVTCYRVKSTTISEHTRRGYRAVRVNVGRRHAAAH